jgi:ABC-type phosphate transport system substrate-binding protein
MKTYLAMAAAVAMLASANSAHAARDYIWAAGSSTVFPFSTRVAENFSKKTGRKAPKVESLGTGGGIKLFCSGSGAGFPDIANASRPMKRSEFDLCQQKGVKDIVQIKIGFDGIVIAVDKDGSDYAFKTQHLFLGLSANILRGGQFVKNPYNSWDDVGATVFSSMARHRALAHVMPLLSWGLRPVPVSSQPSRQSVRTMKSCSRPGLTRCAKTAAGLMRARTTMPSLAP